MKLTKVDTVDARSTDGREVQIAVERAEQQRGPVRLTIADIQPCVPDVAEQRLEVEAENHAVDARSRENSAINYGGAGEGDVIN